MKSGGWTKTSDDASDGMLVEAFRAGDDQAYGELVRRYQIPVFRLLLGLLSVGDEAEELCETVFVRAARHIDELVKPSGFYPWIIERGRNEVQQAAVELGTIDGPEPRLQLVHAVRTALNKLGDDHRTVLILSELQGDEPEAIAAALGRDLDEVRRLVREAREQFVVQLNTSEIAVDSSGSGPALEQLPTGHVVADRYRITGVLGKGGMGIVYAAWHEKLKKDVALKMLHPRDADSVRVRARFEREAFFLGKLEHPGFVSVLDYGETSSGQPYLAMERVVGIGLDATLEDGPLPPLDALVLVRGLLSALEHLHDQDLVHRDLKPENVILTGEGCTAPRILDLGIARLVATGALAEDAPRLTAERTILGTASYMAPEQAAGADADARADLYAVTIMLFEALTGNCPFESESSATLLIMHVSKQSPRVADRRPNFAPSEALEALVLRGMAKRPQDRYQSAAAYRAQLERLLPPTAGGTGELTYAAS